MERSILQSSRPFICVDFLVELADIVLPDVPRPAPKDTPSHSCKIIFVKTEYLTQCIPRLLSLTYNYILLTGCNDDFCLPYMTYPQLDDNVKMQYDILLDHPHLIKWVTKNVCIQHPKLIAFPLGPKMQWDTCDIFGEDKSGMMEIYKSCGLDAEKSFQTDRSKLLYINLCDTTQAPLYREHTGIRKHTVDMLVSKGYTVSRNRPFEKYLHELKTYKFCVSPPGRGIDSHRVWECLMVGTIPICITSPLDSLYSDLPVLIVNDYSIITDEYLNKTYSEMKSKTYNFSKIYTPYWETLINSLRHG
jgi:hypothetical protein